MKKLSKNTTNLNFLLSGKLGFCPPFLIVSSLKKSSQNNLVRFILYNVREYIWGVCDIENIDHSDFLRLYYVLSCKMKFYF